jgi:hypothetical protein
LSFGMLAARNKEAGAVTAITPFILAMGALSDSDADFIKDTCLTTVKRVALNTTPAPIFTSGQLMFLDIGLSEMIQIVALVLEANVGNFIADLQDQLSEAIAKARISSGTPTA